MSAAAHGSSATGCAGSISQCEHNRQFFDPCPACGSNLRHPTLAYILHKPGCRAHAGRTLPEYRDPGHGIAEDDIAYDNTGPA